MNLSELIVMAQEAVMSELISGENFKGLGPMAGNIIMYASYSADDNARETYSIARGTTYFTREEYSHFVETTKKNFVLDFLGHGHWFDERGEKHTHMSPNKAIELLVNRVWNQYIAWAKND